jgi:hypothetical protein
MRFPWRVGNDLLIWAVYSQRPNIRMGMDAHVTQFILLNLRYLEALNGVERAQEAII